MKIDLFQLFSELPDALDASERSRERRNAGAGRLIAAPPPGTPLLVTLALVLEHTGIYLGRGQVAELSGDGRARIVSLTRFVNGESAGVGSLRTGTRVFAACDARTRRPLAAAAVARTAWAAVRGGGVRGYDLVERNCHQFTAACVRGVLLGAAGFDRALGGGVASIDKLEALLSRELNGGGPVSWCAVARSRGDFYYRLTEAKLMRLRLEGVR